MCLSTPKKGLKSPQDRRLGSKKAGRRKRCGARQEMNEAGQRKEGERETPNGKKGKEGAEDDKGS